MSFVPLAVFLALAASGPAPCSWMLPVASGTRTEWSSIRLTSIGRFGIPRKARRDVPAHLHAGVDIARPSRNYRDEPVLAAACGRVISVRRDGPYSQVIVAHETENPPVWSAYEHLQEIPVEPGEVVTPETKIGRFMTRAELERWGMHFDHVHFELLRIPPRPFPDTARLPGYRFATHNLACATGTDLSRAYFDPEAFLKEKWRRR